MKKFYFILLLACSAQCVAQSIKTTDEQKVEALLKQMTLDEKVGHMGLRPKSNTGAKFQRTPDALSSFAATLVTAFANSTFLVAAIPILCGNKVEFNV